MTNHSESHQTADQNDYDGWEAHDLVKVVKRLRSALEWIRVEVEDEDAIVVAGNALEGNGPPWDVRRNQK